jgi:hypothetical protein
MFTAETRRRREDEDGVLGLVFEVWYLNLKLEAARDVTRQTRNVKPSSPRLCVSAVNKTKNKRRPILRESGVFSFR